MKLEDLLTQLGLNISASLVYDVIKNYFHETKDPTVEGLKATLASRLDITEAKIISNNIIEFLAQNGDITISGTQIYASNSVTLGSDQGTKFTLENNSKSSTNRSSIEVGDNSKIQGQGGAKIVQDADGNIKFYT